MPRAKRGSSTTKREFVLSQPLDMPAKDVVAKAKEAGIRIKDTYVYVVRSTVRRAKKGQVARPARTAAAPRKDSSSQDTEFRRLAVQLGLSKAKELLQETEQKLADLIHGR